MRTDSLAFRLFVAAAVWSVVALVAAGLVINTLYRQSVERGFDARLDVYAKTIIAALVDNAASPESVGGTFGEPRFGLPLSGWYWQVEEAGKVVAASPSLFDAPLKMPTSSVAATEGGTDRGYIEGPSGQTLRMLVLGVNVGSRSFRVAVAGSADEVAADIASFRNNVALTLGIFGVGLVLTTLFQVRYGLRPLDRIRQALTAIRNGEAARLEGHFAAEIEPLATELDALLKSNQEIVERARTHVGNLAHALKTPLSVIANEARTSSDPFARKVEEQAGIMRDQVQHYLDRARMAARVNVIGARTDAAPAIESLARAMRRIHEDRGIVVEATVAPAARFRGERQDLEE
ncbi:MAG TPA: HAMP domain-containing sensor histidine kinase, partial [Hyphomicrobiales bacterium]|nr:HAMP domain-containing sensor histidine kinase [Hyphomicrobiales bacterium]